MRSVVMCSLKSMPAGQAIQCVRSGLPNMSREHVVSMDAKGTPTDETGDLKM